MYVLVWCIICTGLGVMNWTGLMYVLDWGLAYILLYVLGSSELSGYHIQYYTFTFITSPCRDLLSAGYGPMVLSSYMHTSLLVV